MPFFETMMRWTPKMSAFLYKVVLTPSQINKPVPKPKSHSGDGRTRSRLLVQQAINFHDPNYKDCATPHQSKISPSLRNLQKLQTHIIISSRCRNFLTLVLKTNSDRCHPGPSGVFKWLQQFSSQTKKSQKYNKYRPTAIFLGFFQFRWLCVSASPFEIPPSRNVANPVCCIRITKMW